MHLVKCENEHIYDADKFRSCPHCSSVSLVGAVPSEDIDSNQSDVDTEIPEVDKQQEYEQIGRKKAAGLLVCVTGVMEGEGFVLREGENVIGRASNMDIAITMDLSISRKNHAVISCDIDTDDYSIINTGKGIIYVNDKQVDGEAQLNNKDVIIIGEHSFVLIGIEGLWVRNN